MMPLEAVDEQTTTIPIGRVIPRLDLSELILGRGIGKGGFSIVSDIISIKKPKNEIFSEEARLRTDLCSRSNLVLKTLRTDLPDIERAKGVVDLAIEAKFLSELQHDHIITMEAMALESSPHNFVILEKLVETLDTRMKNWDNAVIDARSWSIYFFGYCCKNESLLHQLWFERLIVMRDIASALQYLHSQNIVYRDLKPDNIGFDVQGIVKIFDFGLAKALTDDLKIDNDLYKLTGCTGSLRYMAPEVFLQKPYNKTADSYSFGILLWQICSLNTPYAGYTCKMHEQFVVHKGYRPKIDSTWPGHWKTLMSNCWSVDIQSRPDFDFIFNVLENELEELDDSVAMTSDIRAKKKSVNDPKLDVDTRLNNVANEQGVIVNEDSTVRIHDKVID